MIYGDPFEFAVQYDMVESWTEKGSVWKGGLFFIYINGQRVGGEIDVVELRTTIDFYKSTGDSEMSIRDEVLDFRNIYDLGMSYFYGDDELFNFVYDLTCTSFGDRGIFIFLMNTRQGDCVVWSENEGKSVEGMFFPMGTITSVLRDLPDDIQFQRQTEF